MTLTTLQKSLLDLYDATMDSAFSSGVTNPDASTNVAPMRGYSSITAPGIRGAFRQVLAGLLGELDDWQNPTLLNGYANVGSFWAPAQYYRDPWGRVRLRGHVNGGTVNTAIFNLPAGYRPAYVMSLAAVINGAAGEVRVNTGGDVFVPSGSVVNISLDGISFRAEQ